MRAPVLILAVLLVGCGHKDPPIGLIDMTLPNGGVIAPRADEFRGNGVQTTFTQPQNWSFQPTHRPRDGFGHEGFPEVTLIAAGQGSFMGSPYENFRFACVRPFPEIKELQIRPPDMRWFVDVNPPPPEKQPGWVGRGPWSLAIGSFVQARDHRRTNGEAVGLSFDVSLPNAEMLRQIGDTDVIHFRFDGGDWTFQAAPQDMRREFVMACAELLDLRL